MGLIELYRTTGNERYVDLVKSFVNMLGTAPKKFGDHRGMDHSQRTTPIREEVEAVGHAGHANYLYSGIVDLYAETGDSTLLFAIERIWKNVTTKKMYVTGATGPHHFGISKKAMVAESYGIDYEMPNMNAYNETCANIGNAMWNWRLFLLDGEAKYMDLVELVFYNSALSGISLDGKEFFYTNPLRFIEGHAQNTKDNGRRNEFMSVFCCPPNIIRTIAKMHTYAYTTSDKGIWVNLYGSNNVNAEINDNSSIALTQQTNYPWDGKVMIQVDKAPSDGTSVLLRIPAWTEDVSIKVNGRPHLGSLESGSYEEIHRNWKVGDVIELDMSMTPQLIESNPNIEETRNQAAVRNGPIIYCLESLDLPQNIDLMDVVIPQDMTFETQYEADYLSGVTVLSGNAELLTRDDWNDQLYKPLSIKKTENIPIKLIPYFTWANRELSDMTVWIPLKY